MATWRPRALLGIAFIVVAVGSAFAVDALDDDRTVNLDPNHSTELAADEIEVLSPVVSIASGDVVDATPGLLAQEFVPERSGVRVLRPPI